MNFEDLNWDILDRLRATFLEGKPARRAYWTCDEDLHQYDVTFGERIGWKWDAVLGELRNLGWTPPPGMERVLDWGCGSGVAGRRVLAEYPSLRMLEVYDHSRLAVSFAAQKAKHDFPDVEVRPLGSPPDQARGALLILSHVCNELDSRAETRLMTLVSSAAAVLWIEPGTHQMGRRLQGYRERCKDSFDVVAPCSHQDACPLLQAGRERDWCHHFASPPAQVFTDGNWARFARRAGVDLRSLPYSYLALQSRPEMARPEPPRPWARPLGRVRIQKASATISACTSGGIMGLHLSKQDDPKTFARIRHGASAPRVVLLPPQPSGPPSGWLFDSRVDGLGPSDEACGGEDEARAD